MRNNEIRLTEQDLHLLIEDAVKTYLVNEGKWGGLKNTLKGIGKGNWNLTTTYNTGKVASSFQKYADSAINSIMKMIKLASQTNNERIVDQLYKVSDSLEYATEQYNDIANNATKKGENLPTNPFYKKNNIKWNRPKSKFNLNSSDLDNTQETGSNWYGGGGLNSSYGGNTQETGLVDKDAEILDFGEPMLTNSNWYG